MMGPKILAGIAVLTLAAGLVGLGASWSERGMKIDELNKTIRWQETRYRTLVDSAREVQRKLEEAQRKTVKWQQAFDKLNERGPEIRRLTRTVVEKVPEYITITDEDRAAEEALEGLAGYVSEQIAPMLEGP